MSKGIISLSSDEETDVLAPGNKRGLANLFDQDKMSTTGQNPSLHYTAPKQPRADKGRGAAKDSVQNVLIAVPIVAQQYVDGQYTNKGRVSLALLGSERTKDYTLIIYKTQTDRRLTLKVEATLNFNVKENNFVNFYDDTRQAWALKFDSSKDLYEVAFAIAIAKANITGLKTLLLQNLLIGEGQEVVTGDTVGVLYSGWVFSNGTIAKDKPFDSNVKSEKLFKFKLGEKSVIQGWDQGMVGMKRGGKKLIMIPPKLGYAEEGVKGRIPPNACLIFEVELVKAKFMIKEVDSRELPSLPNTGLEDDFGVTVQDRAASLAEQSEGPEPSSKSAIIDRLARVGQQILPQRSAQDSVSTTDSQTSEPRSYHSGSSGRSTPQGGVSNSTANPSSHPPHPHPHPHHEPPHSYPHPDPYYPPPNPVPPPNPYQLPPQPFQSSTALAPFFPGHQVPFPGQPQMVAAAQTGIPAGATFIQAQPQVAAPAPQGVGVGEFSQLMADTRVELGKMNTRLEDIGRKVDSLNENSSKTALVPVQPEPQGAGLMDPGVLLHSINKIVDENSLLKREVMDRESKVSALNKKIEQLLESNQRYVEQSQVLLAQRSDTLHNNTSTQQSQMEIMEKERSELIAKFEQNKRQLDQKGLEMAEFQGDADEIRRKYENLLKKMALAKEKFYEKESEIEELRTESETVKRECDKAKINQNKLKGEIEDLNTSLEELREKTKQDRSAKIKLETKVTGFEDEMNEVREENEQLQRTVEERKQKLQQEKLKMQGEMEQLRKSHEEEIEAIKEHLNTGASSGEVAKIERVWRIKLEQAVAEAEANSTDRIEELQSSEDKLRSTVQRLEKKIQTSHSDSELEVLREESLELRDQLRLAEEKLARALESARVINEGVSEIEESHRREASLEKRLNEAEFEINSLKSKLEKVRDEPVSSIDGEAFTRAELDGRIKQIMNRLYTELKSRFDLDRTYDGGFVLATLMHMIKHVTITNLNPPESDSESEADSTASEGGEQVERSEEDERASSEKRLIEEEPISSSPPATRDVEPMSTSEHIVSSSPEETPSSFYEPPSAPDHIVLPSAGSPILNPVSEEVPARQDPQGPPVETPSSAVHDPLITSSPSSDPMTANLGSSPPSSNHTITNPLGSPSVNSNSIGTSGQVSSGPLKIDCNPLSSSPPSNPSQEPPSAPLTTPGGAPMFGGDSYSASEFFKPLSSSEDKPSPPPPSNSTSKPGQPAAKGSALFSDDDDSDEFDWLK